MLVEVIARVTCDEPGCKATAEYELDFSGSAYYTRPAALISRGWLFIESDTEDDDQYYCPKHSRVESEGE